MSNLIPNAEFLSEPDDGLYFVPWIDMEPRKPAIGDTSDYAVSLPSELCGLNDPTAEEKIAILRYLSLRLARVMYIADWPGGSMLLHCDDEEPSIGDYLEISATILGGLGADVQATSADGEITIDFYPHVDNPKEFLLEYFTPVANYTYATIVDDSEDFEFDIDDAYIGLDELKKLYHFSFFCDSYRILNLDAIVDMDTEGNNKRRPVSDRGPAVSPLLSVRTFDKPTDRISLTIIEIIRFFKSSFRFEEDSDGYEEEEPDIEEMLQEMMIHINEYPDEEEEAREHFEEQSRGYLYDFEFIVESAVYRDLGIKSVEELGNGWLRTVLSPPTNQLAYLNKMGFTPESDDFHDPFAEEEPRGLVRLGLFESVFFTPDEDEETD